MSAVALLEEIADLLCAALGQDTAWRAALGPATRLDGELFLDSLELAAFGAALTARYGEPVDLPAYVAGLDIDAIIELTLAQVAEYVAHVGHLERTAGAAGPAAVAERAAAV
ncbi:hypothetical protein KDL01_19925 [Actinospica durhamensis]|uniref:Acyl carrier protein n=1 Tax=Actinospica durhamensis TaxID=1508375 RepID=A0A941EQJ3_9ACTN|nr:hypothetical protein [Actinospica durhamensis]MBR7835555.1 hypothetical protein [Actinospica durhamensis]